MTIEKAKKTHEMVLDAASKFLSKGLKDYFVEKSRKSYTSFKKTHKNKKEEIDAYIEREKNLYDTLTRASSIYNLYHDGNDLFK